MFYTCLSDIALFINGIETVKAYRFRVANTIYAVDSVFLFLESVPTLFGDPAVPVKTPSTPFSRALIRHKMSFVALVYIIYIK